jgi:hypothetical protein
MRRYLAYALTGLGIAACGSQHSAAHVTVHHVTPTPTAIAGGCGTTAVRRGGMPAWTKPAFADSSGGYASAIPYSVADHGNAVAVLFAHPLRAGHPRHTVNKVLWIMRLPRRGSPLTVSAKPLTGGGGSVRASFPADSEPGEIYPSYVNVPRAGCWHVTLTWAHHTDSIDLRYQA